MNLDLSKYAHNPHVMTALLHSAVWAALKSQGREELVSHVGAVSIWKSGTLVIATSSSLARTEIKLLTSPILESVTATLGRFGQSQPLTRIAFRIWNPSGE